MHYCTQCKKPTNDSEQIEPTEDFSRQYKLIVVSCEDCGMFKYQKLKESFNVQNYL